MSLISGTIKLRSDLEVFHRKNTYDIIKVLKDYGVFKGDFIDVGCSDGWTVELLQKEFGCTGVGITIDDGDVEECKKYGISVVKSDMCTLPMLDDSLDFVYCRQTLEHSVNPLSALLEMKRVVKNDGFIVLSLPEFNLKYLNCDSHIFVMPSECWVKLFKFCNFEIVMRGAIVDFESEYLFLLRKKI